MSANSIHNAIQILAGTKGKANVYVFDATVTGSVDEAKRTVKVTMVGGQSSNELDVRLMSSVDDGAFIYPADNSTVTVLMSEFMEPIIIGYSEVEKITWLGGDYEEVPIVVHPTNPNKGLLKKINDLEDKIKDLQLIFSTTWTPVPNDGGAALKVAAATWAATPYINTTQADISHDKIKH